MEQPKGKAAVTDAQDLLAEMQLREGRICNRAFLVLDQEEIAAALLIMAPAIAQWDLENDPACNIALQIWFTWMYELDTPYQDYVADAMAETSAATLFNIYRKH